MKRGEVWTAAGRQGYAGKPRTVVILQDDRFDATERERIRIDETTAHLDAELTREA